MFGTTSFTGKLAVASAIVFILYVMYMLTLYTPDGKQVMLPEAVLVSAFSAAMWALSVYFTRRIICPCEKETV